MRTTGAEALADVRGVDLVVLDLGLPDMDGGCHTQITPRQPAIRILILTAPDDPGRRLDAGADDYVTALPLAEYPRSRAGTPRRRALLRRRARFIRMRYRAHRAFVGDVELSLTAKGIRPAARAPARGRFAVARDTLMREVWVLIRRFHEDS